MKKIRLYLDNCCFNRPSETIRDKANEFTVKYNIKAKDALHIVCAHEALCHYLLTTDKYLIKKAVEIPVIKIINPLDFLLLVEAT